MLLLDRAPDRLIAASAFAAVFSLLAGLAFYADGCARLGITAVLIVAAAAGYVDKEETLHSVGNVSVRE